MPDLGSQQFTKLTSVLHPNPDFLPALTHEQIKFFIAVSRSVRSRFDGALANQRHFLCSCVQGLSLNYTQWSCGMRKVAKSYCQTSVTVVCRPTSSKQSCQGYTSVRGINLRQKKSRFLIASQLSMPKLTSPFCTALV